MYAPQSYAVTRFMYMNQVPWMILGSLQAHASKALVEGGYHRQSDAPTFHYRNLYCMKMTINTPPEVIIVGQVYRSKQNGMVYDANGVCPCICVGRHSGVEPRIIEYV